MANTIGALVAAHQNHSDQPHMRKTLAPSGDKDLAGNHRPYPSRANDRNGSLDRDPPCAGYLAKEEIIAGDATDLIQDFDRVVGITYDVHKCTGPDYLHLQIGKACGCGS